MRAIVFLVILGAAACATDKPTEGPSDAVADAELAPAIAPPEIEVATKDEPTSDSGAQQYVGLRSPDWLLEAPEPLLPRGERVLHDANDYGLVALRIDGGNELIFLDRRTNEGDFIVEAVLEFPAGISSAQVAWDRCEIDGEADSEIVAVVAANTGCESMNAPAISAWRADPEAGQFAAITPDNIRCAPPTCEQATDDAVMGVPGGIQGGVVGGVVGGVLDSASRD